MIKNLFWLVTFGLFMSVTFGSCAKDTEVIDPYANWGERNDQYLDSIVGVARHAPSDETWKIFRDDKQEVDNGILSELNKPKFEKYDSVYVKYLPAPAKGVAVGSITPLLTDSVDVHYQGFLINGVRFDGSYSGKLDLDIHSPVRFAVGRVVKGWTTALQKLHEGEYVEIYIPYQMAYGVVGHEPDIPGYSVLRFELYLEKIVHPRGPSDYSLKKQENN